jgi:hypothetical protein
MRRFEGNDEFVKFAVAALNMISVREALWPALMNEGASKAIMQMMDKHTTHPHIQGYGCAISVSMSNSEEEKSRIMEQGGLLRVFCAMKASKALALIK